jgi:hypothetical protein
MSSELHNHLIHDIDIAAHEIDDDRHWLVKSFVNIGCGLRKIIGAAGRMTGTFGSRKDYAALIAEADQRAIAGSSAGANGVTLAQNIFSGTVSSLFLDLSDDHFPKADPDKYDQIERGITLLHNARENTGARLRAIELGLENAFGNKRVGDLLGKYKTYIGTHRFNTGAPPLMEVAEGLGLSATDLASLPTAQKKKTDDLLHNLAAHASTDLAFISGTNEAAKDNLDGLIMLRAIVDALSGKNTDEIPLAESQKNSFLFGNGIVQNRRKDLYVMDRRGQPILDTHGDPRLFYSIDIRMPRSAGLLAGLLGDDNYKRPGPGATRQSIVAERAVVAKVGFIQPHHPGVPANHHEFVETPE